MIRSSTRLVSWKNRKAVAKALRPVYTAPTEEAAEEALEVVPWLPGELSRWTATERERGWVGACFAGKECYWASADLGKARPAP